MAINIGSNNKIQNTIISEDSVIEQKSNDALSENHQKKSIVDKYFGIRLSDDELYGYDWSKSEHETFCKSGYYYAPAADGETYTGLAIVEQAEDTGDGTLWLYFTTFNLDLDVYWDSDEGISKKYYSMSFKEAMDSKDLEMGYGGMAIVKKEGDSYKLKYYKIY